MIDIRNRVNIAIMPGWPENETSFVFKSIDDK